MAHDEQDLHPRSESRGFSPRPIVMALVAVLVLAIIYAAGMMMGGQPIVDRGTTGSVLRTEPSANPPTVTPPPLAPQQVAPDQITPQRDLQANPPRGEGG